MQKQKIQCSAPAEPEEIIRHEEGSAEHPAVTAIIYPKEESQ
jgi:hypothetical protein